MTSNTFGNLATKVAIWSGRPVTFAAACGLILAWAIVGPFVHYSDVWQLTINTGTTIITFLMVFIIQNSQNRDSAAVQIKLNELLRSHKEAKNILFDLEELSDAELEHIRKQYEELAARARKALRKTGDTGDDNGTPQLNINIIDKD